MAVSINWGTKVIFIPQADLTLISGTIYELDVNWLRLQLKSLEDSPEGISYPDTHRHNTEVVLSGVTYARTVEIINGYTITFEETLSHYTIRCAGANHNIADVLNPGMNNLIISNSAGLQTVTSGSGVTLQDMLDIATKVWEKPTSEITLAGSIGEYVSKKLLSVAKFLALK